MRSARRAARAKQFARCNLRARRGAASAGASRGQARGSQLEEDVDLLRLSGNRGDPIRPRPRWGLRFSRSPPDGERRVRRSVMIPIGGGDASIPSHAVPSNTDHRPCRPIATHYSAESSVLGAPDDSG